MDWTSICECVATCSHACLNSGWEANMAELQILCASVDKKWPMCSCVLYVCVHVCVSVFVFVCDPAGATKCSTCWGSSPFDKLSPGFSCSPASLCWTRCEGTGPPASPLSPRSPGTHTQRDRALTLSIFIKINVMVFIIYSFLFVCFYISACSRTTLSWNCRYADSEALVVLTDVSFKEQWEV